VAAASAAIYYSKNRRAKDLVLTGIVSTDDLIVSSQIEGRLSQLLVKEGTRCPVANCWLSLTPMR